MNFEIENLEDVIKEALSEITSDSEPEVNEIYNRDIKKIWDCLLDSIAEDDCRDKEEAVLYMPRKSMLNSLRSFYGIRC